MTPLEKLERRVRGVNARAQIRKWQFRQRHLAAGTWDRVRLLLAYSASAYEVSTEDAQRFLAERGCDAEPAGMTLVPPKTIFFVAEKDLARLPSAQPLPISLGPRFMGATVVALVAFLGLNPPGRTR